MPKCSTSHDECFTAPKSSDPAVLAADEKPTPENTRFQLTPPTVLMLEYSEVGVVPNDECRLNLSLAFVTGSLPDVQVLFASAVKLLSSFSAGLPKGAPASDQKALAVTRAKVGRNES